MQPSATNLAMCPPGQPSPDEVIVLIVDDYQDCREMYAVYLTLAGFRVLEAANGPEALAIARRTVPDLVLMDLGLPDMDGCEITRRLKRDPLTVDVPVIALTAQCLPDGDTLRATGFETVVTKPCRPDDLADLVAGAVRRAGRQPVR
jgi:CheY-like chemotaxis protein